MEVILLERVAKLGQMGDVVRVKDGFARNYLLPKGKALRATKDTAASFTARSHPATWRRWSRRRALLSVALRSRLTRRSRRSDCTRWLFLYTPKSK